VNISLIGQSVSTSKFNPTRPFIQEVSTSKDSENKSCIFYLEIIQLTSQIRCWTTKE